MMRDIDKPQAIGLRRELFVDHQLVEQLDGASLVPALPRDEGIVFQFDRPWEGLYSGYGTVMQVAEGDYRLYYSGCPSYVSDRELDRQACVAFSDNGVDWRRPSLGLFEVHGTHDNNVVLAEPQLALNFSPFEDPNAASASERFKAVGGTRHTGLLMFSSADGLRWSKMFAGQPILQADYLDAKNVVFWSPSERCYVLYARLWQGGWEGWRWIGRATSDDLQTWTSLEPVRILHEGRDVPMEHYYHSGVAPYFRAPHIYVALCSQLTERPALDGSQVAALNLIDPARADARSGGGLMTSRGGGVFERTFMEEFIRPPMGPSNWLARCNYPLVGVVQTGPTDMSFYTHVHAGLPTVAVRRYTLRLDGFSSLRAPFAGGGAVTRPLVFEGTRLSINYATSSRGYVRMGFETPEGRPIPGFGPEDCDEIVGNDVARWVRFRGSTALDVLSGCPVRLRIQMRDADLFAMQFQAAPD